MNSRQTLVALALMAALLPSLASSAKDFVLDPKEQHILYPQNVFRPEEARFQLEPGECRLSGIAYDRQKSGLLEKKHPQQFLPAGAKIHLFPYTA